MPYPQNVQTAREVEQIIRDAGAVPATIAIIGGKICIGLPEEQLEELGNSPDAIKVSRRDLAYVLSQGKLGATTVAATMICAQLAGIKVFVTGGIGGVHRGAETSMDISADLQELAQTNVAVGVCGREVDPRHRPDAGIPGDSWRAGDIRRPAWLPRHSSRAKAASMPTSSSTRPPIRHPSSRPSGPSA